MSYVTGFLNIASEELDRHPQATPLRLVVEVGEMAGVLPEYLYKYYPLAAKNTPLRDTTLEVIYTPVAVECTSCGCVYHPERDNRYACPSCGQKGATLLRGRECKVKRLVLEEA